MKIALSKNPVLAMLENYGIHPECGFLPSPDPLERLPEEFEAWETMAQGLPKFLISGKVRTFIDQLPILDASRLSDEHEQRRAMVILSFLGHAYVWGDKGSYKFTAGVSSRAFGLKWHAFSVARRCYPMPPMYWTTGEDLILTARSSWAIFACGKIFSAAKMKSGLCSFT
jgi:hypothetical protein